MSPTASVSGAAVAAAKRETGFRASSPSPTLGQGEEEAGGGGHKGAGSVVSAFVGGALSSEQVAMQVSSRVVGYSSSV